MAIYKPNLLDKFKDFVNGLRGNADILESHLAGNASYGLVVTRGISQTGVQTIALPFTAKSIICFAFISGTNVFSNGFWAENDVQRVVSRRHDNLMIGKNNAIIHLPISAAAETTGSVQNVTDSGFEINWSNTGSPTGTATLYILVSTRGEG